MNIGFDQSNLLADFEGYRSRPSESPPYEKKEKIYRGIQTAGNNLILNKKCQSLAKNRNGERQKNDPFYPHRFPV